MQGIVVVGSFFLKLTLSKHSFRSTNSVSKRLDPNQDQRYVGPDLGPDYVQRLSVDDKCSH